MKLLQALVQRLMSLKDETRECEIPQMRQKLRKVQKDIYTADIILHPAIHTRFYSEKNSNRFKAYGQVTVCGL